MSELTAMFRLLSIHEHEFDRDVGFWAKRPALSMRLRCLALTLSLFALALWRAQTLAADIDGGDSPDPFHAERPVDMPSDRQLLADGAVFGTIQLDRQPIFDHARAEENNALFRAANRFHTLTRPSVIRSQLLFSGGDPFDPRLLRESERILRANTYLYDARVVPVAYENGRVDIKVTTRDVWTLTPIVGLSRSGGENRTLLGVEDQNFLGSGALVGLEVEHDVERDSLRFFYADRQLGDRWISLGARYEDNTDGDRLSLSIRRPFYALDTRWAGGFAGFGNDREQSLYDLGDEVVEFRHEETFLHLWYGWSPGRKDGWTRRWRTGFVSHESRFGPPDNLARLGPIPEDREFVYPYLSFELLEDRFDRTRNHDQMGRTEDFYLGTRVNVSLGWGSEVFGSRRDAWLYSASASHGMGKVEDRMLLVEANLSGRHESGSVANGLFAGSARFYYRQSARRLLYLGLSGAKGRDLDLDNPLQLGGDSGLRGYPIRYQSGDGRALLTIEQRYFTDWYPWRLFRVGGAVFADIGRTWGNNPVGGPSLGLLKDVGVGLRLAPTRGSGRKVIHVDIAFPLDGTDSIDAIQISFESKRSF